MRIEEGKNIWVETEKEGFEAQVAKAGKHTFYATDKIHAIVFCNETLRSRSVEAIAYPSESAAGRDRRKKLEEVKQMIETKDVYLYTVKLEQILNILKQ